MTDMNEMSVCQVGAFRWIGGSGVLFFLGLFIAASEVVGEPPTPPDCSFIAHGRCWPKHISFKECNHKRWPLGSDCFICGIKSSTECYIWSFYINNCTDEVHEPGGGCLMTYGGEYTPTATIWDNGDCDDFHTECTPDYVFDQYISTQDCSGTNCNIQPMWFYCQPDLNICGPPHGEFLGIGERIGPIDIWICNDDECQWK